MHVFVCVCVREEWVGEGEGVYEEARVSRVRRRVRRAWSIRISL